MTVYSMVKDVGSFNMWTKVRADKPRPDNIVFRIHYQFTFSILCLACVLVTSYSYIDTAGSAIQCMTDKDTVPGDVLNSYCWIMSTFSLPRHFEVRYSTS